MRTERPATSTELGLMEGAPPLAERLVTRWNWETPPFNRWAFRNVDALFPTAVVPRGDGPVRPLPSRPMAIGAMSVDGHGTVDDVLAASFTDGFLVLHRGEIVCERYDNGLRPETPHLLASITKSVLGTVAGILVVEGRLDPARPVTDVLPELAGTAFDGASLRHILDMTAGTRFGEDYADPASDIRQKGEADGWDPRTPACRYETIFDFLKALGNDRPHGAEWAYRSCLTDVLGWVLERVTGTRVPELIGERIWSRIGAEHPARFMLGPTGQALYDGGLLATLRDLGRFGLALAEASARRDISDSRLGGLPVVPADFVADTLAGDDAAIAAFRTAPSGVGRFPGGHYRNQFWVPRSGGDVLLGIGIYGQYLWMEPGPDLVIAKLSSLPVAATPEWRATHLRLFEAISSIIDVA